MRRGVLQKKLTVALPYVAVIPFLLFIIFPFLWMVLTSFRTSSEIYSMSPNPFRLTKITLEHYIFLFETTLFTRWYINTLLVAGTTTIISVCASLLAGYSLARLRFRGSRVIGMGVFFAYLVPASLLFIPLSVILGRLDLLDNLLSLILTYPTFMIPFCTWLLMGYFANIPKDIEEAALVDGASRLQTLLRVVFPAALPGIVASTIFSFLASWGHLLYAVAFTSRAENNVLTNALVTSLIRGDVYYYGSLMAGAVMVAIPVVVLFSFILDYYVQGLTQGATKF
jgi:multiple sugar transport system permease protein